MKDAFPLTELATVFDVEELRTEFDVEDLVEAGLVEGSDGF